MSELPTIRNRHWIEYVSSFAAVVISIISLWVAIRTERANSQMVAASSWPFLEVGSSSVDNSGRSVLSFSVANTGVGPAKIRSFKVFYKGRPYRTAVDLIRACCNPHFTRDRPADVSAPSGEAFITGGTAGSVIRAGESHNFIAYGLGQKTAATWYALERARQKDITYRICYCSVFDECWLNTAITLNQLDPVRVGKCPIPKLPYSE